MSNTFYSLEEWNLAQIKEMFSDLNIYGTNVEFGIDVNKLPQNEKDQLLALHYGSFGGRKYFREHNYLIIDGKLVHGAKLSAVAA